MMYAEGVMVFLGVSLFLYLVLGGADFGAGILELIIGDRSVNTVYRAIAPVWEANHMWLIIAVVIMFNGFPEAYAMISTALHIPIMLVLMGIILRGTAFTFRHYDAKVDESQHIYSRVFRWSSAFTVFSMGLVIAPLIADTIPPDTSLGFYAYYVAPWFNGFAMSTGVFVLTLSAYISAIYLLGEVETQAGYTTLVKGVKGLLIASVISGLGLFLFSHLGNHDFHERFFRHPMSVTAFTLSTLMAPIILRLIKQKAI